MSSSWNKTRTWAGRAAVLLLLQLHLPALAPQDVSIAEQFGQITGQTEWSPVGAISIPFDTFHPQGMTFVDENIVFSSVEVTEETQKFEPPTGRYDRTAGQGVGHLFKVDRAGNLLASIRLGEDSVYHPGGIDFDGRFVWVPVAEYRPNSSSIVYRVDPFTMEATEVFRFADHLGALVYDAVDSTLHGVSWGSRFFYSWKLNGDLQLAESGLNPAERRAPNGSYYIDYQDCLYVDVHQMLCGGLREHHVRVIGDTASLEFTLGGLELLDLRSMRAVHQVPFNWGIDAETAMSANPFCVEPHDSYLRFYFMPEDNESTIYIFEAIRD